VLGDWLAARGYEADTVALYEGRPVPAVDGYDLVVSLGSEHSAYDDTVPWQADVQRALRSAGPAGAAVLGVCFGGQALARALGGEARPAERPEIGWVSIGALDGLLPDGPWFSWHGDEMVPPPDAEILARNASGVQAWRLGRSVGIQFHPEVSGALVDEWLELAADRVRARGVDPEELSAETHRRADVERSFAVFDALLGGES
jgi:GMP synthase-like glutamine amidotransferase